MTEAVTTETTEATEASSLVWIVNNNQQTADEYVAVFGGFKVELIESNSIGGRFEKGEEPKLIVVSTRESAGDRSGFFLIKQIRKVFEVRSVPILMISADTDAHEEAESLNRGADEYFYEPLSPALVSVKAVGLMRYYNELNTAVDKGVVTWKSLSEGVDKNMPLCSLALVDDEIKHREILEYALEHRYKITSFVSGIDALVAIRDDKFSLVILDIKMPNMDGYEVIDIMHGEHLIENTPVIFGTGKTRIKQIVKGLQMGAVDYLQKPYVADIVRARINVQLTRAIKLRLIREALALEVEAV